MSSKYNERINFGKIAKVIDYPDFLDVQLKSFQEFFQLQTSSEDRKFEGLFKVFSENFPITDTRNIFVLEFLDYFVDPPRYTIQECIERGLTYAVPLKAKLKLSCNDVEHEDFETVVQDVYLGTLPYMSPTGSFIINGAERVIVSQLHRSPGVFFGQSYHTNGTKLYSARIIPFKGSWIEFATDVNNVMYAYIDRKKKFPVTTLLRAIGYETDKDILDLFGLAEDIKVTKTSLKKVLGRRLAARVLRSWIEDFVDEDTGEVVSIERNEVVIERDTLLEEEHLSEILESGVKTIILSKENDDKNDFQIILNTLQKDTSNSGKEAVEHIYRQLRNTDPPDEETARGIIERLFFSDKRYDLGEVGRYRINKKLELDIDSNNRVLTNQDIISIIQYLIELVNSRTDVDDIDHLSNRRVRTVGEQLYNQFGVGLARMARTIRERMNIRDNEVFTPTDLVNARTLSSVINSFFGTNQLSQFMDQTNPLSEITHKRRVSALGPGGLTRERAGFEVRDVHYTHYGRLCPIETPEGPNIGLISSLGVYAKVNNLGFIETPYRKVNEGKINLEDTIYLSAEEEENQLIAQANIPYDKEGKIISEKVIARDQADFPVVTPDEINYTDVAPNQIASISASLIPFLEHDDANRALMGSNMMRQAVPLLRPESPIVGTGLERQVASDSRVLINAEGDGKVENVDANKITVKYDMSEDQELVTFDGNTRTYDMIKFRKTNQGTCINLKPIVKKGDRVSKGQVLSEGYATQNGELALGRNMKVAFMPWKGYNFEDAILISEKIVKDDIYTSIHIEEFEVTARDTKLGPEEITRDIPNAGEEALRNLDHLGVVRIGAEVKPSDILVGKITPKSETDLAPEEKLLRAIFGEKAADVKDSSLKVPSGTQGIVMDIKISSRTDAEREKLSPSDFRRQMKQIKEDFRTQTEDLRAQLTESLSNILLGEKIPLNVTNSETGDIIIPSNRKITKTLLRRLASVHRFIEIPPSPVRIKVFEIIESYESKFSDLEDDCNRKIEAIEQGDPIDQGAIKNVRVFVAKKQKMRVGDKMAGRHGNKGVVAKIVAEEDMPFLPDGTPIQICLNPLGVPSRMNVGQVLETHLGWACNKLGLKVATPIFDGIPESRIQEYLKEAKLPDTGKTVLYDGCTGEAFYQKIVVGYMYMLKLNHLVSSKIHARAVGPYSLITQQPLGGKAQYGGQRFGEMEVWALEAYGAAYTLQEILTVKSDDVAGRTKIYESLVKGDNSLQAGTPQSFNVLMKEMQSLCLDIRVRGEDAL